MFQHALIISLKWISRVSLDFRPSSDAHFHLTWVTAMHPAAWGRGHKSLSKGWNEKRSPCTTRLWGKPQEKLLSLVDFIKQHCFKLSPQVAHQWARGSGPPKPEIECQPLLPADRLPSDQPWSTITPCHLQFLWRKKGFVTRGDNNYNL